jgi:pSer/pThr/pTyr-binding forkhead associated (FHA) protein
MTGAQPPGTAGQPRPPGSGGSLLAWLWGEQGHAREYLLAGHSVTVGRDPRSDIVLSDPTVSREHARIFCDQGQWWLLPARSASPTWVNGRRATPGQRVGVTDGDRLRFGFHTQLRLLVPSAR